MGSVRRPLRFSNIISMCMLLRVLENFTEKKNDTALPKLPPMTLLQFSSDSSRGLATSSTRANSLVLLEPDLVAEF